MPKFYLVDRSADIQPGQILENEIFWVKPAEFKTHLDKLAPGGLSRHGELYLLRPVDKQLRTSMYIELLLEYVRRAHFPKKPSRFQSIFAVETLQAARKFRKKFGKPSDRIWEVQAKKYFKADMSWLNLYHESNIFCSIVFNNYWKGKKSNKNSFYEVLLTPPVVVLREI